MRLRSLPYMFFLVVGCNASLSTDIAGTSNKSRNERTEAADEETTSHGSGALADRIAPRITYVSSSTSNGAYSLARTISIQVCFDEPVIVNGVPTLTLATTSSAAVAVYSSGSTSQTLDFKYKVLESQNSSDLDYGAVTSLALPAGASIKDLNGNDALLTLPQPGAPGSLGVSKQIVIDTTRPKILGVTTHEASRRMGVGDSLLIDVRFSESVSVAGSPSLLLETGATDAAAVFVAQAEGPTTVRFRYTVQSGEVSPDLDYQSVAALGLNGGAISDVAGNAAELILPAPGAADSLAASKDFIVDTVAPAQPGAFTATAGNAQVSLDWTAGDGTGVGYLVVMRAGSGVTWTPVPRRVYDAGDDLGAGHSVIYRGSSPSHVASMLTNASMYHFAVFAYDEVMNCSVPSFASALPYAAKFVQVSSGLAHNCALTAEGKVWCWGNNDYGQLGHGGTVGTDEASPVAVDVSTMSGDKAFTYVAAARYHTCGITADGKLWCWGRDNAGQLGNGAAVTAEQTVPSPVATSGMTGDKAFIAVALGDAHTCGLTAEGKVWCWGSDGVGELGNGAGITGSQESPSPLDIAGMTGEKAFASLTAGSGASCGITAEGKGWCWGQDTFGKLGNGAAITSARVSPSPIDTSVMTGELAWRSVSVASFHSCGVSSEGKTWCWGSDIYQALGNGAAVTASQASPYAVDIAPMAAEKAFASVTTNLYHSCGLTSEGKAWCWGRGDGGQLGSSFVGSNSPRLVDTSTMTGNTAFVSLSVGGAHTCALTAEGKIWCWGSDGSESLGNGSSITGAQANPSPLDLSNMAGEKAFVQLATGSQHTCGLTSEGKAYCWGSDTAGQLGNGSLLATEQASPTPVDTSSMIGETLFVALSTGQNHTCGLTKDGKAWCWGSDSSGAIGNGAGLTVDQPSPSPVDTSSMTGEKAFVSLSAGSGHTCGLTAEGKAWCWGADVAGQLGNGAGLTADQPSPGVVDTSGMSGEKAFMSLTSGSLHTCGLTFEGRAWCWGRDNDGQLGNAATAGDQASPTAVSTAVVTGEKAFILLSAGDLHTCGLTSEGKAWCWGSDADGQLGDGGVMTGGITEPTAIDVALMTGEKGFVSLSAAASHTCGLTAEGKAWCWGSRGSGRLGGGAGIMSNQASPSPVDVSGMTGEKALVTISAAYHHTCALTSAGQAWCWGGDDDGRLGNGAGATAAYWSPSLVDMSPF